MVELTEDEETVLEIMSKGQYLAPIGRWEGPIKSLEAKGFARAFDPHNYGITALGQQRFQDLDKEVDARLGNLIERSNQMGAVQAYARAFVVPAAQLLAQAAEASARVTGESLEDSAEQWGRVILAEAKKLLRMQPTR